MLPETDTVVKRIGEGRAELRFHILDPHLQITVRTQVGKAQAYCSVPWFTCPEALAEACYLAGGVTPQTSIEAPPTPVEPRDSLRAI